MKTIQELLLSNKGWAREMRERKDNFFSDQTSGQNPEILWIGCSDSRVSPDQITQTLPGELFIHRNIANIVHTEDENLGSVVQFALEVLKVRHVVICGHYGCGGIEAALDNNTSGPIDRWLSSARQVEKDHSQELENLQDREQRINRLVELNVRDQLIRLGQSKLVQEAFARDDELTLHGLVYDLRDGLISQILTIDGAAGLEETAVPDTVLTA